MLQNADEGDKVLYVRCFEKLQASVLVERDVVFNEHDVRRSRVRAGPEQYGLFAEADALFKVLQHLVNHKAGLEILVLAGNELGHVPLGLVEKRVLEYLFVASAMSLLVVSSMGLVER